MASMLAWHHGLHAALASPLPTAASPPAVRWLACPSCSSGCCKGGQGLQILEGGSGVVNAASSVSCESVGWFVSL